MFAAPNPSDIKDVESNPSQIQQNAAMYPNQQQNSGGNYPSQYGQSAYGPSAHGQQQQQPQYGGSAQAYPTKEGAGGAGGTGGVATSAPRQSMISRVSTTLHWGTFVLLLAFLSMMVMIASAQVCSDDNNTCTATRGYQVSLGTISLILCLIFGFLDIIGRFSTAAGQTALSVFFFLWWTAGVIVLTFWGDFQNTTAAAGYFSSWFAFIVSIFTLINVSPMLEQGMDSSLSSVRRPLFFLSIASLVAMGASVAPCHPSSDCVGYSAWAIVASVASACIAIVLFFFPASLERRLMRWTAWLFVLWWIFGVSITTLGGPFQVAGNGFFGVYGALFASCWLAAVVTVRTQ